MNVVGDAYIQRSVMAAGENVDIVDACGGHRDDPARAVVMDPGLRRDDGAISKHWNKLRTL
jgi:hypothetical protein